MLRLVIHHEEPTMPVRTKTERAAEAAAAAVPRTAFSIPEFCAMNALSEGSYLALRRKGLAPRETRVLRRVLITAEAAAEWVRKREAESAEAEA
jgi:hypothetical protein